MNYSDIKIVIQEVPGEISICFSINGCEIHCKGCHSSYLWNRNKGEELTEKKYKTILKKYNQLASCVLFMGGEWHKSELIHFLRIAKTFNYKTCLYTGEEEVSKEILAQLTWVKTGRWIEERGGLMSNTTNQEFKEAKTDRILNYIFQKN